MWRGGVVAVVLVLSGCSESSPEVECDGSFELVGFDSEEEVHVRMAFAQWNAWEGAPKANPDGKTCRMSPSSIGPQWAPSVRSLQYPSTGEVRMDRERMNVGCPFGEGRAICYRAFVLHELGHSFGLVHLPEGKRGIMSAEIAIGDLTDDDRAECVSRGVCR